MSYAHSTVDVVLEEHVGDKEADLHLAHYADADFTGCADTNRSTSVVLLAFQGKNTLFSFACMSKRQSCVSISTAEAELVAASEAVRLFGAPAQEFWEVVLRRKVTLDLREDSAACISIIRSGKNPATRHVSRTHRVRGSFMTELFSDPSSGCTVSYQESASQARACAST